jgi:hypothetical protein
MATSGLQFPNLDAAIAAFEGYGTAGTVATRQNNPGNLVAGPFSSSYGGTGTPGSIATFPNAAAGLAAEDALVQQYESQGYSVGELINAWAPSTAPGNSPASTQNYTNYVSQQLGVSPTTPLSSLAGSTSASTAPASSLSNAATIGTQLLNSLLGSNIPATIATGTPTPLPSSTLFGVSFGRIGGFILGFVLIVGAIYLFKPVRETVGNIATKGAKATAKGLLL